MAPHTKIVATFLFAIAVATTPSRAVWAFAALAGLLAVATRVARLPLVFVASRALVVAPFVGMALLVPFVATGHDAAWGPITWSSEGAWAGFGIIARSLLGVTASVVLVGTTELPSLLAGLDRLHVPPTLTAIASFMLRYLELVAGELRRMRQAMLARGHDPRWLWQVRPLAVASGALFVRTYERGERVHLAMQARGFTGEMPRLHDHRATRMDWTVVVAWAGPAMAITILAQVLS